MALFLIGSKRQSTISTKGKRYLKAHWNKAWTNSENLLHFSAGLSKNSKQIFCSAADKQELCPSLHEDLNLTQQDAIPDQYPEDIIVLDRLEVNIISQT